MSNSDIKELEERATANDAVAQFELALFYLNVRGDEASALKWLQASEKSGHLDAVFKVAQCYENGELVKQNVRLAASRFRKAAEQGHVQAQVECAKMFLIGKGVVQDEEEAFTWYQRAAEQGHAEAQYNVGEMYSIGRIVPADLEQAKFWLRLAAASGHLVAKVRLLQLGEEIDST